VTTYKYLKRGSMKPGLIALRLKSRGLKHHCQLWPTIVSIILVDDVGGLSPLNHKTINHYMLYKPIKHDVMNDTVIIAHIEVVKLHHRMVSKMASLVFTTKMLYSDDDSLRVVRDGKILYPYMLSFPM
jgi:hypothetical protein